MLFAVCIIAFVVGAAITGILQWRREVVEREMWSPDPNLCWCGRPVSEEVLDRALESMTDDMDEADRELAAGETTSLDEFDDSRDADDLEVALRMDAWLSGEE